MQDAKKNNLDGCPAFSPNKWVSTFPPHFHISTTFSMQTNDHILEFRVYLEDTDAQGIVYHGTYLRYFERGRSELFEALHIPMEEVARPDCRLVVHEIRMKFRRPAFLGDRIQVVTSMQRASEYRLAFRQQIRRRGEDDPLVSGEVDVVAIDRDGALKELPEYFGPFA
jgi:acyl-CoA thioester hydrolase